MMFEKNLSDLVVQILVDAGVKRAYGVPGDATDLILASIHKRKDIDFFLIRAFTIKQRYIYIRLVSINQLCIRAKQDKLSTLYNRKIISQIHHDIINA